MEGKSDAVPTIGRADSHDPITVAVEPGGKVDQAEAVQKASLAAYIRIFSYSTPLDIVLLCAAGAAAIGAGITLPLMNVVFGKLVGSFNGYFVPGSTVTASEFESTVNHNALYIVYLFIGKFVLCYISMFSFRMIGIRISGNIRLAYLRALFAQPISVLDKLPPGQAASTITSSANTLQIGISDKLSLLLMHLALAVSACIVAFIYSWKITLVSSALLLFIVVVYSIQVPIYIKLIKSMEQADEKASSVASEVFGSIRMIFAYGAESRMAIRYNRWVKESLRRGLKLSPATGSQFAPSFFAIYSSFALVFWFGIKLYSEGQLSGVQPVITCFFSVMVVVIALGGVAAPIIAVSKAASAATGFFELIDSKPTRPGGLKGSDVTITEDLIFEDVNFAYPSRPQTRVLNALNLRFQTGKLTAIVGASGSGKSTIVALLERWYDLAPQASCEVEKMQTTNHENENEEDLDDLKEMVQISGSVKLGRIDLKELDVSWWRSQIGLVQQEPFLFNDTIFSNVAYGLIGSKWEHVDEFQKRKLVEEACQEAFAHEFINRLPNRYETQVGDGGIKLSGGQRQRLAIARSIIKRPALLILDEATSSIDVRSERIVQEALDKVSMNRTTITIAHRLSTIKKADKIIVLKKGSVVEEGTHNSLLAIQGGVYHNLVHAQRLKTDQTKGVDEAYVEVFQGSNDTDVHDESVERIPDLEKGYVEPDYKAKGLVNSFGLLLFEQKSHWIWYTLTALGVLGCGSAYPIQSYLFAHIVTVFQETGQQLIEGSHYWALRFFILALGVGFGYLLVGWCGTSAAMHVSATYRQQYFESILKRPIVFFDAKENASGTLVSRASNDPTQLQQLLGMNMAMLCIAVVNIIGCIALAFAFGWKLTLVAIVAALPIILTAGYYRIHFEIVFEEMNAKVFAESSQFAAEAIGAFRTVTSLTLEEMICDRYSILLDNHVKKAFKKARLTTLIFASSDSIPLLCMALTFWYGGKLLSTYEYSVTQFLAVYVAIIQGSEACGQWSGFGPNMAQASAAANRILSLRIAPERNNSSQIHTGPFIEENDGPALSFEDVHFKYPTRDVPIFSGLNLTIHKGQFAALVGASGCGKTSIISLLERFYSIQSGRITINGVNISDIDLREYRQQISLVAQEPTLFQGTIRENILLGTPEITSDSDPKRTSEIEEEMLIKACTDASIHAFITSLPEGYSTSVGSRGIALSGGQKQRIAIARALIRNPRVLLLDEATSSLDSESEKLVQASFERAASGRTMVVVAHRLATVQNADIIFVLGEGGEGKGVIESGSHDELLRKRGVYWQMCESQALE